MDRPSPFAAAKTIRDIGSPLPLDLGDAALDREEHARAAAVWFELSQGPLPLAVENAEYFNNWTVDLDIIDLEIAPGRVRVSVDFEDADDLAKALGGVLGRRVRWRPRLVDILLHDVGEFRAVEHNSHGTLRDVRVESQSTWKLHGVGTLLNEWFYAHGDRLGWVADTHGLASSGSFANVHLLVDCARASVVDHRLETLVEEFGPAVAPLWHGAFEALVDYGRPRGWWMSNDLTDYLAPKIAECGLTASDFLPSTR